MTGIAYPSLCMACSVGEHRGPGEGGVCECACHRPVRAAGIDPAALTSDETVTAAFDAFNGATAVPFEAMRAALRAAALAAQGTGGDDGGEALKQPKRRLRELLVELGQVPYETPLDGVVMRVNEIIKRGHRIADELHIAAPASSTTQEGRRDGE